MLYYSYRTRKSLIEGHTFLPLGFAHYSYGSVSRKFISALGKDHIYPDELLMPEIYADFSHVPHHPKQQPAIHIAFKPFDEIRLLKGAINIAHVAWEFEAFPSTSYLAKNHSKRDNPTNDYISMLHMLSEVWVGSSFTKKVLERHGVTNVHVVPAPIAPKNHFTSRERSSMAMASVSFIELTKSNVQGLCENVQDVVPIPNVALRADECRHAGGRVFLSVLNPGDARKNVASLLTGFQQFIGKSRRKDVLILKLVIDGSNRALKETFDILLPRHFAQSGIPLSIINCMNIIVVGESLSESAMASLYALADFYICSSGAEGQGLPVLEAMAAGLPIISSRETAMADYITSDNAIVLSTSEQPIPLQISEAYSIAGVCWHVPDQKMIERALWTASAMNKGDYEAKSRSAKETIGSQYSESAVSQIVQGRLHKLGMRNHNEH